MEGCYGSPFASGGIAGRCLTRTMLEGSEGVGGVKMIYSSEKVISIGVSADFTPFTPIIAFWQRGGEG